MEEMEQAAEETYECALDLRCRHLDSPQFEDSGGRADNKKELAARPACHDLSSIPAVIDTQQWERSGG